jgi:hypothetical protein
LIQGSFSEEMSRMGEEVETISRDAMLVEDATTIALALVVRCAFDPLEDTARLSLETRRDEQLGRARRVGAFASSLEIDGNALSLESALDDLSLDPRLCPEH